ncbi:MAG: RAMP superfamily CRISPR-associated protein [Anaerovibrio sp.]
MSEAAMEKVTESKAAIIEKIQMMGRLVVQSPLCIGSGQDDGITDSLVLKNRQGQAFIPGTSLAGTLRDIVYSHDSNLADMLFGELSTNRQSMINIDDVLLENSVYTVRDGVRIDSITNTAEDTGKFDYEVVERGAAGSFSATITIRKNDIEDKEAVEQLAAALADQLMYGISLGAHTAKGFGEVKGSQIKVATYDFSQPDALGAWLLGEMPQADIYAAAAKPLVADDDFYAEIDLALKTSLLIGAEPDAFAAGEEDAKVQKVMLSSKGDYVIPGTSVKGVIRKQAEHICRVVGSYEEDFLGSLMGYSKSDKAKQRSRLRTCEVYLRDGVEAVNQSHVRIDRFTGGHMGSGLFTNKPLWQQKADEKTMTMRLAISGCSDAEAGLMLLILKDIWTGQLAFGGDKAGGSGVMQGLKAVISYKGTQYIMEKAAGGIKASAEDRAAMNSLVEAFVKAGVRA